MSRQVKALRLDAAGFAPFGDVLEARGAPDTLINDGVCARFHDRATLDFAQQGRAGLSIFNSEPCTLPYRCTLLERHPLGSQAFVPMHQNPFLVIVAGDRDGTPGDPRAFVTAPGQGINLHRGTWHGVLTPLARPGLFAVVDWIGTAANVDIHHLAEPFTVTWDGSDAR